MECWNDGALECWSVGVLEYWGQKSLKLLFSYPLLHHSNIPSIHFLIEDPEFSQPIKAFEEGEFFGPH